MTKSAKTPYEIRLDILSLARQILSDEAAAKCALEWGDITLPVHITLAPSVADVIAKAELLYAFVGNNG